MNHDPFKEYLKEKEPNKRDKGYAWQTAIGLQAVDGLKPSKYLIDTAIQNIEGEITIDEAQEKLNSYYEENPKCDIEDRTEEADKVSVRIAKILSEQAFSFTPNEYISIHKKLFIGIYGHAGKIRDYNITKKEWVLDGATILYGSASELRATLEYDFSEEKKFSYKNLSMEEIIHHLAVFVSRLWQIHIFGEGNTRTTAVFFIKYLRTLGFDATNDIFAENAWYFRNALVRANYNDLKNGIHETAEYLDLFLRNLLLDEKNELHNRSMHISGLLNGTKADIEEQKSDIEEVKADIKEQKSDIEELLHTKLPNVSEKTKGYVLMLYREFNYDIYFGRSDVERLTGLKSSRASELLKEIVESGLIEPIKGHGKGKYQFVVEKKSEVSRVLSMSNE
jgi:fido (protein-threonine AMPylation protein)